MKDPRINELAKNLINYSTNLQKGEKILIETIGHEIPLTVALIEETYKAGGQPFVTLKQGDIQAALLKNATKEQLQQIGAYEAERMKDMDAYVAIRINDNSFEMAEIPSAQMQLYKQHWSHPVHHEIRVPHTKWVILRYPNHSMAQMANMPTDSFEDFYFSVCNLDYAKMAEAMTPLVELMNKTHRVQLKGPKLDLSFEITDIPAVKCAGKCNIPDGEVYTAPVKNSLNGHICYNTPALHDGITFENITFEFKDGKILKAEAGSNTKRLNEILESDEGARYIGEFALGLNPNIEKPIFDTLFDEKIRGSFHLTPGACYDDAYNGNKSIIHWDLVHIQTPEYGGGEIYFDDVLVRKDGLFVLPELEGLNPENLR
ncbi:MAG: aminopeptidase [Clostridia bacterium]|nr:aminopeptidase [Clostridia bacterium]